MNDNIEQNNTGENNTSETELHYSWVNYPKDMPEEEQEDRVLRLGGDSQFLHAEVVTYEDDSVALKLVSTGIGDKYSLMKYLESLHTIAQHDYLESQKESRE